MIIDDNFISPMTEVVINKDDLKEGVEIVQKYPNLMIASISNAGTPENCVRLTIINKDLM